MLMRGRETPKNQAFTILKGFSTVSEAILVRISSDTYQKEGLPVQKLKDFVMRIEEFR